MSVNINRLFALMGSFFLGLVTIDASATNGYFSHAYGNRSGSMAGANTALPLDSIGAAINPALMAHVGKRLDIELQLFNPVREAKSGFLGGSLAASGEPQYSSKSNSELFLIPTFGYTEPLSNNKTVLGISIYGNGGMNTDYPLEHSDPFFGTPNQGIPCATNKTNLLGGCSDLGVDFSQLVFAPTIAHKISKYNSVGVSLLVGYQRFKAEGLHAFQSISSSPNKVTNNGYDTSLGFGLRLGWLSKISDDFTVGAAYSSKIYMSKLDKYSGLLAEQGTLDIPANASIGLAYNFEKKLTMSADLQWIGYSKIKSIGNTGPPITGASPFPDGVSNMLGNDKGLGFGWDDMVIGKLGIEYHANENWIVRGGVSHGKQPIRSDQLAFNLIATAVPETHVTAGFAYRISLDSELTVSYMYAVSNSQTGGFPEAFCTQGLAACPFNAEIKMKQNALSLGYSWEF